MRVAMDRNSSPGAPFVPHWVDDVLRLASDARHRGPDVMSVARARSAREEVVQPDLPNTGGSEPRRGGGGAKLLTGKSGRNGHATPRSPSLPHRHRSPSWHERASRRGSLRTAPPRTVDQVARLSSP